MYLSIAMQFQIKEISTDSFIVSKITNVYSSEGF